jgi:hypothetical protein
MDWKFSTNWSFQLLQEQLSTLFLGFSAAMLGISGLKVQNFVEEQEQGVFKTLRNMWAIVFFNPVIAFVAYLYHSISTSR